MSLIDTRGGLLLDRETPSVASALIKESHSCPVCSCNESSVMLGTERLGFNICENKRDLLSRFGGDTYARIKYD